MKNYHPSILHQAIRDDDISLFQRILSQNNFNVNHRIEESFYERTSTTDKDLSLIQIAALYGSLNIFKFLWMQNDIFLDNNLQFYSYSGRNLEIIHICEQKCSFKGVLQFAIHTHQNDLVDYYLDNFENEFEEDSDEIKGVLKKFEGDDQNPYKILNYKSLKDSISAMNWKLILPCLPKIVYLIQNYEENESQQKSHQVTLLEKAASDMNLFKFLYSYKNSKFKFTNGQYFHYLLLSNAPFYETIYFLLRNENHNLNDVYYLLYLFSNRSPYLALIVLEFVKEKEELFPDIINIHSFESIIQISNEDLLVRLIQLFPKFIEDEFIQIFFCNVTAKCYSAKMTISVFKKISSVLSDRTFLSLIILYKKIGYDRLAQLVLDEYNAYKGGEKPLDLADL